LLALLADAGHTGFRDARGPMGFTQRQAAGRFTRDEAEGFIDLLQETQLQETQPPDDTGTPVDATERLSAEQQLMRRMPAAQLAGELKRRGWTVVEP
jgi:hypothetical protein